MLVKRGRCTGCMACVDVCPKSAIKSEISDDGFLYPVIDPTKCVNCQLCTKVCPAMSELKTNPMHKSYAAWANDLGLRLRSSSGGVFAAMAARFLDEQSAYVYGASSVSLEVIHISISQHSEIHLLQGSKYAQGNLSGVYQDIKIKLESGHKVLFSGTPCQVAALHAFLRKGYDNLTTIDVVCGGFPSKLPLYKFIEKYPETKRILSYRDKRSGWRSTNYLYNLTVENNDGNLTEYGVENLIILSFGASITHRKCCYDCKFVGLSRCSDLTIGDFWGDVNFKDQHHDGLSVVMVHTSKGDSLLRESDISCRMVPIKDAIKHNMPFVNGVKYAGYNPFRILMNFCYKRFSYDQIINIYKGKGILGTIYRIAMYSLNLLQNKRKLNVYKSVVDGEKGC